MRSSDRAGHRVLGLQEKVDGAHGKSGRQRFKATVGVRQFTVLVFGAVQT